MSLKLATFEEYHPDRPVLLKLVTDGDEVDLDVVDEHGDPHPKGKLLAIRESGVYLYTGISPDIGLPLDSEQRLKVFGVAEPKPEAKVMELLRPLAEYIRERNKHFSESDDYSPLLAVSGQQITLCQLRSLANYYEKHK